MMSSRVWGFILSASLCIFLVIFAYLARPPFCFDSKSVYKIDRVDKNGSYTIYRCSQHKQVPYDPGLGDYLPELNHRLQKIDGLLSWQKPMARKIHIAISETYPYVFGAKKYEVIIGKNILSEKNHLEKAIFKIWLQEQLPNISKQHPLYTEALTDLMVYIAKGELPESQYYHWSKATLSLYDYCQSPWKLSEHESFCQNKTLLLNSPVDSYLEVGLRPILTAALIDTYKALAIPQKMRFFQNIIDKPFQADDNDSLQKVLYNFVLRMPDENSFYQNLYKFGIDLNNLHIQFDYVVKTEDYLPPKSEKLTQLREFAIKNPQLKIAVESADRILVLPNFFPILKKTYPAYKVFKAVMVQCGPPDIQKLLPLSTYVEHLLYVDECGDFKAITNSREYMIDGIQRFASLSNNNPMIQFHLPSLMLVQEQLTPKGSDFYSYFNKNYSLISQQLGWTNVEKMEGLNLHKPIGFVDAIEWYKLPN